MLAGSGGVSISRVDEAEAVFGTPQVKYIPVTVPVLMTCPAARSAALMGYVAVQVVVCVGLLSVAGSIVGVQPVKVTGGTWLSVSVTFMIGILPVYVITYWYVIT
jgi:hypothetical protein